MQIYQIKANDTLWKISNTFNVPVQSLISVNGLDSPDKLIVGMHLLIPDTAVQTTSVYTVKRGDTLFQISRTIGVDLYEIAQVNNLAPPYTLAIGQKLIVPRLATLHTVKSGETLWQISKKYNTTVSNLAFLNNLPPPYNIYPGQTLVINYISASQPRPVIETLGYYNLNRVRDKETIINSIGPYLTYLGAFDFTVSRSGQLLGRWDRDLQVLAESKNASVLPVITNLQAGAFNSDLARMVLSDFATRNTLIDNILLLLNSYNLLGVIIDFENLYPQDRNIFTQFIALLYDRLHSANKILVLNMAPKWEDLPNVEWAGFFDYKALGPIIDIAAIMTYEWGWREGSPRPTAPLENVKKVIEYAISNNIPANKIYMGLTLYGYDWIVQNHSGELANTVTLSMVRDFAIKHGSKVIFDPIAQQPYISYVDISGRRHEVWFENALSHYIKYQLIKDYGLRGVFYWIIDQPFPATWYMVNNLFKIRKI